MDRGNHNHNHHPSNPVPTVADAGVLDDLLETPAYVMPAHVRGEPQIGRVSCGFCGVGDGATLDRGDAVPRGSERPPSTTLREGPASLLFDSEVGDFLRLPVTVLPYDVIEVRLGYPLAPPGGRFTARLEIDGVTRLLETRVIERVRDAGGQLVMQRFKVCPAGGQAPLDAPRAAGPTVGCVKLRLSLGKQPSAFPIHTMPSVLDRATGARVAISYDEAISRFAGHLLDHRRPHTKTLVYGCGQLDYFAVFALQEVFRLLGVRSLAGNAEHCLNAGAVHNEILTGQEGPFLTIEQAISGPSRFFLLNGWNGIITHPPVFRAITSRPDLDAFLVEVAHSESAELLARKLGPERVLLIRPRGDPHLALAVAHEIAQAHPQAISQRFVSRFADGPSFERYLSLARQPEFSPEQVAARIAPSPEWVERLVTGIRAIARKLADPSLIPINVPSVGLSQTSGVVAHCLWGNVLALVGKYGLAPDSTPLGGTLRLPGQINAETEVQGLSRNTFMGRIPMSRAADAAARAGLPPDAYDRVVADAPRAALDYSDPSPGNRELFVCLGTQFEANMMGRRRWIEKLRSDATTLVVIDPVPDPFTLEVADLILPSPPHAATTKLYQNGEWRLTLSIPHKRAPVHTRSDATILYDVMAEIGRLIGESPELAEAHPDLARHVESGYIGARFGRPKRHERGLTRIDREVSRPELWARIQEYMSGGEGPLYCRPEHADGRVITWEEIVEAGQLLHGGVGVNRYALRYDDPECHPFRDVLRRPVPFRFFVPTDDDLRIPEGPILTSGRGTLTSDRDRIAFATATFNSGKATPLTGMPDEHPLFVSPALARAHGLSSGDLARVQNLQTGESIELPVEVSERLSGDTLYVSFHKSRAQLERGLYVNDVTSQRERCPYTAQTRMKATQVLVEKVVRRPA